jgi:hypothetical protein
MCEVVEVMSLRDDATARIKAELDRMDAEPQPGAAYTCIGKGGLYIVQGMATGAGASRGDEVVVYADEQTGRLFYRTARDFAARMALVVGVAL